MYIAKHNPFGKKMVVQTIFDNRLLVIHFVNDWKQSVELFKLSFLQKRNSDTHFKDQAYTQ